MNRGYKYSRASKAHILTLTESLQNICHEGLEIANTRKLFCPDVSIVRSRTTKEEQFKLFMKGRKVVGDGYIITGDTVTNCDGYEKISDHQKTDNKGGCIAFDFAAWVKGTNYDDSNIALIMTCYFEASINQRVPILWGGGFKSISDGSHVSQMVY